MDRQKLAQALRDTAQSTSNAISSNVSFPVDAIAWALRKAGLPIPENAMGGSDWMAQKGLTAPVQEGIPKMAGEVFGGIGPAVMAAKAPQIAGGLLRMGENAIAPRTLNPQTGAIVWHGSPHKFDKFDSSKIGTGEGAQAYGHGLYFAENPSVAREYQEKLSSTGGAKLLASRNGGVDGGLIDAQRKVDHYKQLIANGGGGDLRRANGMLNIAQKQLDDLQAMKAGLPENTGSLYKVDLPDEHIAKMLDWDKPLSQQSKEVQKAIAKTKTMLPSNAMDYLGGDLSLMYGPDVTPKDFLNTWESFGAKAGGESALQKLGIPGVRYLDGGSRGAGQGSSNFVVFPGNEGLLNILERNGSGIK